MLFGQVGINYIVKILIAIVVIVIVTALIWNFSDDIRRYLFGMFHEDDSTKGMPERISKASFTAGEVANYAESCYLIMNQVPENEQKDMDCYILVSSSPFGLTVAQVQAVLPSDLTGRVDFQTSFARDLVIISYSDLGNRIVISD